MAWVYILRCGDNTFYVGHCEDLEARVDWHRAGLGARHTALRLPIDSSTRNNTRPSNRQSIENGSSSDGVRRRSVGKPYDLDEIVGVLKNAIGGSALSGGRSPSSAASWCWRSSSRGACRCRHRRGSPSGIAHSSTCEGRAVSGQRAGWRRGVAADQRRVELGSSAEQVGKSALRSRELSPKSELRLDEPSLKSSFAPATRRTHLTRHGASDERGGHSRQIPRSHE